MKEESPILERPRIRFNSLKRIISKNVPCIAILQVSFSSSLHVIDFSIGLLAVDPRLTEEERTKIRELHKENSIRYQYLSLLITSSLRMSDLYKQNEFKGHHIDNTLDTIDISHYDEYSSNLLLRYFKSTFLRQCSTSWWNQFCVLLERNWKVCSSVESSFSIGVSAGPDDRERQILSDDLSCCYCWNHFSSTWLWTGRICCSFLSILLGHSEPIRCSVLYYDESCFWTDL